MLDGLAWVVRKLENTKICLCYSRVDSTEAESLSQVVL